MTEVTQPTRHTIKILPPYISISTVIEPKTVMGNIMWSVQPPRDKVLDYLEKIRNLGYWASFFPEGDGIVFMDYRKENHHKFSIFKKDVMSGGEEIFNELKPIFDSDFIVEGRGW